MRKEEFLCTVAAQMKEHPEWLNETMQVANSAILERISEDREVSTNIQFSLSMLYDNQFGKLNEKNQIKVLESILECDALQGSPFSEKIKEKLEKKLKKERK